MKPLLLSCVDTFYSFNLFFFTYPIPPFPKLYKFQFCLPFYKNMASIIALRLAIEHNNKGFIIPTYCRF